MQFSDLVRAVMRMDALAARQWVLDAKRSGYDWRTTQPVDGLPSERTVAAGLAELLAERAGVPPPSWAAQVPGSPEEIWLVELDRMPRLAARVRTESPEPLRRRRVFAPADFLTTS